MWCEYSPWPIIYVAWGEHSTPIKTKKNMYYVPDFEIETIEDVKNFFTHLVKVFDLNFNPDTPFSDYIELATDKPTFTPLQCEKLDRYMQQCIDLCEEENVCVYDLALSILFNPEN